MNDSKNMILAVVLSALVLLGWTWAANRYFPTANPPSTQDRGRQAAAAAAAQAQPAPSCAQSGCRTRSGARLEARALRSARPRCSGSINLKGAQIDDLLLLRQRQTIARNSPPVRLLSPLGAPGAYIAEFGWTAQGRAGARPRHDVDCRQNRARPRPAGDAHARRCPTARATRSGSRSMTAISSPSSRASLNGSAASP